MRSASAAQGGPINVVARQHRVMPGLNGFLDELRKRGVFHRDLTIERYAKALRLAGLEIEIGKPALGAARDRTPEGTGFLCRSALSVLVEQAARDPPPRRVARGAATTAPMDSIRARKPGLTAAVQDSL